MRINDLIGLLFSKDSLMIIYMAPAAINAPPLSPDREILYLSMPNSLAWLNKYLIA